MQTKTNKFRLASAKDIDEEKVDSFMRAFFSKKKCDFLRQHALWRHCSNKNRMLVLNQDDEIVGYCAAIPAEVWIVDHKVPAFFWVDNYVSEKWRGKRIQSLTDKAIREMEELQLGFPNKFVVPIHHKHGWDVREDFSVMLIPLRPKGVVSLQASLGRKKTFLHLALQMAEPVAWLWRQYMKRYKPTAAMKLQNPDPEHLAAIFRQYRAGWVTVNRTSEHMRWRYIDSPNREEHSFYVYKSHQTDSLAAVCRLFNRRGVNVTRILDIFGNLEDKKGMRDILRLIVRDAVNNGSCQVTAMATNPIVKSVLRSSGFVSSVVSRFRCFSRDANMMKVVRESRCHWVFADSDNDSID